MEIIIIDKKENQVLNRTEVSFKIEHEQEATPSREVVIAKVAAMLNAETDRTILKEIKSHFGVQESAGKVNLYYTAEDALKFEPKHILIRNKLVEADK